MPYRPQKVWREVEIRRPTGDTVRLRTLGGPSGRTATEPDPSSKPGEAKE